MTMDYNPKNLSNAIAKFEEEVARADAEFMRKHAAAEKATLIAIVVCIAVALAVVLVYVSSVQ